MNRLRYPLLVQFCVVLHYMIGTLCFFVLWCFCPSTTSFIGIFISCLPSTFKCHNADYCMPTHTHCKFWEKIDATILRTCMMYWPQSFVTEAVCFSDCTHWVGTDLQTAQDSWLHCVCLSAISTVHWCINVCSSDFTVQRHAQHFIKLWHWRDVQLL